MYFENDSVYERRILDVSRSFSCATFVGVLLRFDEVRLLKTDENNSFFFDRDSRIKSYQCCCL